MNEAVRLAMLTTLPDQIGIHPRLEVLQTQIDVVHPGAELGGEVVAQIFRIQMIQIGAGLDEGAAGLGHLGPVHREEAVGKDGARRAEAGTVEHRRPEQGMEVDDVLADEVIELGLGVLGPEAVELQPRRAITEVLEARHIADGCIQPDVEEFVRMIGDLETEIRGVAGDVPLLEPGLEPLPELVGDLLLEAAAAGPGLQHLLKIGELEEEVLGLALLRDGPGDRRARVLQLIGRVTRPARLAVVAILVRGAALGALALDEAIRQEHLLHRVIGLGDGAPGNVAGVAVTLVDERREVPVLVRVGRVVVVEDDPEGSEIRLMLLCDPRDQFLRGDPLLARLEHDRGAVGVVRAHIPALVPAHPLKARPDVGLDVFHQMADVDGTVGVGQRAGDQDLAGVSHGASETGLIKIRIRSSAEVSHERQGADQPLHP